jgi:CubicO group peptidase (beta-lactamase class C family)
MKFPALLIGIISSAVVGTSQMSAIDDSKQAEPQQPWSCYTASDAEGRKKQVEQGMLPPVVFDGEIKPLSVESRMAVYKTPALSVAVIHKGKLDWSAAWGRLQTEGAPADCGTLFQAGSLAKPFTLLAALRMKTAGLIDIDRNIETYLSSYHLPAGRQTDANPVTFRNLLAHTAGITPGGYAGYAQNEPIPTDQQIVRGEAPTNSRKVEVLNTPGASLGYSGGGYTVVEIALQDQLHKPFDQIMREWVLAPVGMRQADFAMPLPASSHPHSARGHQIDGTLVPGGWNNYPEQAAAGLWATATDLAMFLLEIHKGYEGTSNVFTQVSIREMLANPIENHVYGFRLIGEGNQVFITHYGGTVGYTAGMTLNLRTGDGAVFLINSDNGANLGTEFFSAVSRAYEWPTFREEKVKRMKQPTAVLQSLTGNYVFPEQAWTVSVVYEHDSLTLVFPKGNRLPLVMVPIQGRPREFIHDTGVHASFDGEGKDMKIHLYGQTGQRQVSE